MARELGGLGWGFGGWVQKWRSRAGWGWGLGARARARAGGSGGLRFHFYILKEIKVFFTHLQKTFDDF